MKPSGSARPRRLAILRRRSSDHEATPGAPTGGHEVCSVPRRATPGNSRVGSPLMTPKTFDELLGAAEEQLWIGFQRAGAKRHPGSKGVSREGALAEFLGAQLPKRFGVTTGEAVDASERRSGQLDVVVFDRNLTAPLLTEASGDLLPAEALLAVIEVKSTLTRAELRKCAVAAEALSELRPYGKPFLAPRLEGEAANDGRHRCMYTVLAFRSDLSKTDWPSKEWARLTAVLGDRNVSRDRIDRVLVLDRGLIVPPWATARVAPNEGKDMLREWFLHMSNFLIREASRRPLFDFSAYGRRKRSPGWEKLPA